MIYLDNAAGSPLFDELIEAYSGFLRSSHVNASATHGPAYDTRRELVNRAEAFLDRLDIDAEAASVVWTSGGTEANNLAIGGLAATMSVGSTFSAVTTITEHASVFEPFRHLESTGANLSWARVAADGTIDLDHFASLLNSETKLVSICHVQTETGAVQDLVVIREIMDNHAPLAKLHVDAIQALGKLDIPWHTARIDLLSLSGHKIHGPGGVGALIARHDCRLEPLFHGGGQQENLRSGSLDIAGIRAFCAATRMIMKRRPQTQRRVAGLNRRLRLQLDALRTADGKPLAAQIHSSSTGSDYILSCSLPGYQGAVLARALSAKGIIVGTGSACAAESKQPSRILMAMGVPEKVAFGSLRVSFGCRNRDSDGDAFCRSLQAVITEY